MTDPGDKGPFRSLSPWDATSKKWAGSRSRTGKTPITPLSSMPELPFLGLTPWLINLFLPEDPLTNLSLVSSCIKW